MGDREAMLEKYRRVRQASMDMCRPLEPEDYQVQTMEEVSPPKWNLGHTSWFFWNFILRPMGRTLPEDERYRYYLNSYYYRAGRMGARGGRGLVTRPTTQEIYAYRSSVDWRMEEVILNPDSGAWPGLEFTLTVGLNHEQQHQELFFTEIKNIYFASPENLRPVYIPNNLPSPPAGDLAAAKPPKMNKCAAQPEGAAEGGGGGAPAARFIPIEGGLYSFGNVEGGWCWDNELDCHQFYLKDFAVQDRPVTCGEYLEFIEDGGYSDIFLWLSDGWREKERQGWAAPLYWEKDGGQWRLFTLSGMRPPDPDEPVCHVSLYEAHAFARWKSENDAAYAGARLPTEYEWEHAARTLRADPSKGNFAPGGCLHPAPAGEGTGLMQAFGDVWEWTSSHYGPYPGFREFPDNLSEYNGKFMNNQRVLRGGSCATPEGHMRTSYRNFWHPAARFQFSGARLARDI